MQMYKVFLNMSSAHFFPKLQLLLISNFYLKKSSSLKASRMESKAKDQSLLNIYAELLSKHSIHTEEHINPKGRAQQVITKWTYPWSLTDVGKQKATSIPGWTLPVLVPQSPGKGPTTLTSEIAVTGLAYIHL